MADIQVPQSIRDAMSSAIARDDLPGAGRILNDFLNSPDQTSLTPENVRFFFSQYPEINGDTASPARTFMNTYLSAAAHDLGIPLNGGTQAVSNAIQRGVLAGIVDDGVVRTDLQHYFDTEVSTALSRFNLPTQAWPGLVYTDFLGYPNYVNQQDFSLQQYSQIFSYTAQACAAAGTSHLPTSAEVRAGLEVCGNVFTSFAKSALTGWSLLSPQTYQIFMELNGWTVRSLSDPTGGSLDTHPFAGGPTTVQMPTADGSFVELTTGLYDGGGSTRLSGSLLFPDGTRTTTHDVFLTDAGHVADLAEPIDDG